MVRSSQTLFISMKSDIQVLTLTIWPNHRSGRDFGLLTSKNVFVMKFYIGIVLRGFIRGYLMQKLGPFVCMHFTPFIGYVFTFFLPLKINSINSEAPKTITRYPILFIFFYLLLKQNFLAYERNGSIAQAPQGIEPALNRFCHHFFGHPYSKSWST